MGAWPEFIDFYHKIRAIWQLLSLSLLLVSYWLILKSLLKGLQSYSFHLLNQKLKKWVCVYKFSSSTFSSLRLQPVFINHWLLIERRLPWQECRFQYLTKCSFSSSTSKNIQEREAKKCLLHKVHDTNFFKLNWNPLSILKMTKIMPLAEFHCQAVNLNFFCLKIAVHYIQ